jgi:hypothetical protein
MYGHGPAAINIGRWRSLKMVGREEDNEYGAFVMDNRDYP